MIAPGDLVLAHGRGFVSKVIRFDETIKLKGFSNWNHAAMVVSVEGDVVWVVQAEAKGIVKTTLDKVAPGGSYIIVKPPLTSQADIDQAVEYVLSRVGEKYGVLIIVSIVFNQFTPKLIHVDFRREGTLICSGLVARGYEHGGWNCPSDPFQISPEELGIAVGAER